MSSDAMVISNGVFESDDFSIRVKNLTKCFEIYDHPGDRLKQFVYPLVKRSLGRSSRKYYREFWALKNIDLDVRKGQTVGVIGKNGSGKSTLLQMICGTLTPTSGQVQVNGRVAALLELGSGFNPEFSGRENVFFNAGVLGQTEEVTREKFKEIESFADIGQFIDQPVKTYSSGMMVRLAFAVIAHVDADVLIIDEALSVGDAFFTQKCMRFLREFMKTKTVLFVSHDLGAVKNLCSSAIWIDKGKVLYSGDAKVACDLYLESLFGKDDPEVLAAKAADERVERTAQRTPSSRGGGRKDMRTDFINASSLRNDIKVYEFIPDESAIYTGKARIEDVRFCDDAGESFSYIVGGETVCLEVKVRCLEEFDSPIVGFFIKDRLGQNLFGDNTWLNYCDQGVVFSQGDELTARFVFEMPRLMRGDYSITVSCAQGSQEDFTQHHWIHDAVNFSSHTTSVAGGLIGVAMQEVCMDISEAKA